MISIPKPCHRPIRHRTPSNSPLTGFNPLPAEERYLEFANEMTRQSLGLMPVQESLDEFLPNPPINSPYIPSPVEAKHYLYGLPSRPRMIARSSADVWMPPTGAEAYLEPKEFAALGAHRLDGVWEDVIGPAMEAYLGEQQVVCSLMHPVRLGKAGLPSPPAFIMLGVSPDSVSAELGLQIAVHCRSILLSHQIQDVHVIVYESKCQLLASMYKPAITANPVSIVREPFSTSLGISICNAKTTNIEGNGGIFFIDSTKPGKLFLLTARHVLFHPDEEENKLYRFRENSGDPQRKVMMRDNIPEITSLLYISTARFLARPHRLQQNTRRAFACSSKYTCTSNHIIMHMHNWHSQRSP
ncbi:hypothetical protein EVG20_g5869 [Dentipellis fragilis]|uniref:Uncharacterized protein n=1 Tax=Dentipellis fragilis TaxID=205917 RepID=A0A4Y9YR86_9AGAM|nr:hypothetical protein EVG20_g5869 [Dentipellis fragilis]